jgi:prepilin-type N-terminal cleavage/methylation domain-containing protein
MRNAFSLLELAVVLVILGLITGGIIEGKSLIRAGEVRAASSELIRYDTAVNSFYEKYNALPGDMKNATTYWGAQNANAAQCAALTVAATGKATCNGNGDGMIHFYLSTWYERYRAWQHLANAGMIEGRFSGVGGTPIGNSVSIAGTNVPESRVANGSYYIGWWGTQSAAPQYWNGEYGNVVALGKQVVGSYNEGPLLTPTDAQSIDTKLDDGKPGTGLLVTLAPLLNPNCSTGGAWNSPEAAAYNVRYPNEACGILYKVGQ